MPQTQPPRHLTRAPRETLIHTIETLPDAFFVVDDAETIVYANASTQALTQATAEQVVGTSLWRCAPQLVSTALYQAVQQAKQTRAPTTVEYISPVTQNWLHVSLSPTEDGLALFFQQQQNPLPLQHTVGRNKELYRELLESFADGVTIVTPDGLILDINERPLADAHLRREAVVGKPFTDLPAWSYDPEVQEHLRAAIARASRGETVRFEARIHPRTDLSLDILMTITAHRDASQHVEYLICAGRDITERKRTEEELRALIDAIPHFVWTARPDGAVEYVNQRWCEYINLAPEQLQGDHWLQVIHPDDRARAHKAWQTAIDTGTPYAVEHRIRDGRTGAYRWFLARGIPYQDAQGTILSWVGTCTDIDEQKRAEQKLTASERNFRMLAETVPQLVWTMRADGLSDYFNQRFCDYTHACWEQLRGYGWSQFLHPDDYERTLAARAHAFRTGTPYEVEYRFREGQTGLYRWFLARAMPVRDEAGQILKWFGTCTDIHEKKQAEDEIRVLIDAIPQFVWMLRPDGSSEYGNRRWCEYTGMTFEHYQGDGWLQAVHPDDYQHTVTLWRHARSTGEPFEIEYRLKDGTTGDYRWFLARAMPVRDDTGQIVKWFGTCTDIEDQKRVEEALRQSQERANVLMNASIIGVNVIEREQIVDANDTFLRMTGYTREDLHEGRMNVMQMTVPEYLARTQQAHQELATQQLVTPYEKEYIRKDGSHLPVLVCGVVLQHHPSQAIGFVLDNSARKELEQRKDTFISMASHELRNPLTALKLQTHVLTKQLAQQGMQDAVPSLARMETQINTITRLVKELLDVSKIQAGKLEYVRERVDLDALLREIADTMQQTNPSHRILVHGAVQASLIGDPDRLGQVFINLLSNAIKYSPNAQTVEMDLDTSQEKVTIRIHDHGLGIPPEQRDKIFERFYRVSGPNQRAISGLGMGLYIVAEIVKRHGGTISVDSDVGTGSTFTVTLPRTSET